MVCGPEPVGKLSRTSALISLATLEIYDPQTDEWTTGAPMPYPKAGLGLTELNGLIFHIKEIFDSDQDGCLGMAEATWALQKAAHLRE